MSRLKIKELATSVFLTCIFAACIGRANQQDTVTINLGDYEFKQTPTMFGRTQVIAKRDNKPLQQGLYKTVEKYRHTIFNVNDSGYLQGEKSIFAETKLHSLSKWDNGKFLREYIYSYDNGRLLQELFDSSATVFKYDSITNNWNKKFTPVKVRKEFSFVKGAESNWTMVFSGGTKYAYASFSFRNGKMISESYPDYTYRQYNDKGKLVMEEVYNWKLKQRENTTFRDSVIWKSISTDQDMIWNKDGTISYRRAGEAGENKQWLLYKSGKLARKEVHKNFKQTIIEYDNKGKIKSKEVYQLSKKVDNEVGPPA